MAYSDPSVTYRDRAVLAFKTAEANLRAEFRAIIAEATNAEEYRDVAFVAGLAATFTRFVNQLGFTDDEVVPAPPPPKDEKSHAAADDTLAAATPPATTARPTGRQ